MRKIILALVIIPVTFIGNVQARSLVFNLDEVDFITFNKQSSLIEDIRDGYISIKGINVTNEIIRIDSSSNIKVQFRNGLAITYSKAAMNTAISSGGDMGGGGK